MSRPTPLRLAGFVATAAGGAMAGIGSLLAWVTVSPPPVDTNGVDVWEGKITAALAILMLGAVPAMRLADAGRGRRLWAAFILVAGLAAGGIALADAVRPLDRFRPIACDEFAGSISEQTGLPAATLQRRCEEQDEELTRVQVKPGLYLVVVGGLVGALGGALSIAWASKRTEAAAEAAPPE